MSPISGHGREGFVPPVASSRAFYRECRPRFVRAARSQNIAHYGAIWRGETDASAPKSESVHREGFAVSSSLRPRFRLTFAFVSIVALYNAIYVYLLLSGGPLIGPSLNPLNVPFPDFLVFQAAARAWLDGQSGLIYDVEAFTRYQAEVFVDTYRSTLRFRPFLYPPTWLLVLLPLGLLATFVACAAFMGGSIAVATALEGFRDWWGWAAIVASPAAVRVFLAGQNTFLSLALFYGGFRLLERSPVVAGILLGLLSYKPQLWILVPFALLAGRHWVALWWTIGTVFAFSLASLSVFGVEIWAAFFGALRDAASESQANLMFERNYMLMTTLLASARILGLPTALAGLIQVVGACLAIAAVWFSFRRFRPDAASVAVLLVATFLVSPYTLIYDLLLLMPAAVMLYRRGATGGFYPLERIAYAIVWVIPVAGLFLNFFRCPVTPLVLLLFGGIAWARMAAAAASLRAGGDRPSAFA